MGSPDSALHRVMDAGRPTPEHTALADYRLDDNLTALTGRILISGTQALVRLPLMQARLDLARGWHTAGFVSGYRGSPLGAVDQSLWKAQDLLDQHKVRFMPAINEELGAAACSGTQRVASDPDRRYEGVFAMWYGKGPGVDRAGDTLRHGNAYGSSARGGVLVVAGDDHGCVSSGIPFQSDIAMQAWSMPVLHPANVAEMIEFGLYGWALSRYSGAWCGLIALSETVEGTATVDLDRLHTQFDEPADYTPPAGGLHYRLHDLPGLGIEARLAAKLDAVRAFAHANPIDRWVLPTPQARIGIITCGKAHLDVMEALRRLDLPLQTLAEAGIRFYKVGLVYPLEPRRMLEFTQGLSEILVVEEKAPVVENQLRAMLYNHAPSERPVLLGKTDIDDHPLLSALGELRPSRVMPVLAHWLARHFPALDRRARVPTFVAPVMLSNAADTVNRMPYFCAGCPHNVSTRVPTGSDANAGIGCHAMAGWMDRSTTFPQVPMGAEGVDWVAQSFFTQRPHRFQNMGDGTYSHSGYLAIRQAAAAGANITYKILYNDAVAMTGGQPVDRRLSVPEIARQVQAEGVQRIAVVTESDQQWHSQQHLFPPGTTFHARTELDAVQQELRTTPGVTVLIFDQVCATEQRRRIKRGMAPMRTTRVFIHPELCENCGDCTAVSNCVAIRPLATAKGRKRQIDQTVCNQDLSCLQATCPAMVTIEGATLRKKVGAGLSHTSIAQAIADLPLPPAWHWNAPYDLVITGVGGTGIITVGALVTTAAHLEGKSASVLDFMGFAQKGGSVIAFVRLAHDPSLLHQARIDTQQADAMIVGDLVVGASANALQCASRGRTRAAVNLHQIPTYAFVQQPEAQLHTDALLEKIVHATGGKDVSTCDAQALSEQLFGDTLTANVLLLGFAWQHGLVPLSLAALERALELNEVAVDANKLAFACGRLAAAAPQALEQLLQGHASIPTPPDPTQVALAELIEQGCTHLQAYQNQALADTYRAFVQQVQDAETRLETAASQSLPLTRIVAQQYARLLACKDEYEVARQYSNGSLEAALAEQFSGDYRIHYHFLPEYWRPSGTPQGAHPTKVRLGSWTHAALRALAGMRALRASGLDPFGWLDQRRRERNVAAQYRALLEPATHTLSAQNHANWVEVAALAQGVRGYGTIREKAAHHMLQQAKTLLTKADIRLG